MQQHQKLSTKWYTLVEMEKMEKMERRVEMDDVLLDVEIDELEE